jgi:phytoene desaturase
VARVVVIGAGMGGLAAAARLAAQKHQVTVVEQSTAPGGKLASYRRDGFVFDTGPSLLTLPAVYRDLFLKTAVRRSGAALEDNVELVPVDPAFGYRFADGSSVELPNASRGGAADALDAALGAGAGQQWTALVDRGAAIWQVTRRPFLTSPLTGPWQLVRQSIRLRDLRTVAPFTSLRSLGRQYLRDPRLQQLFERYATYAGSDPRRAPAALATIPYVEQTFGAWHVGGGLARLATATYDRCRDRGVVFRFGADVVEVMLDGGRASGVRLADGEALPADVVVANADASHLYRDLLPRTVAGPVLDRLARTTPSLSGFVLLLAVRGRTAGLRHHTVLFSADYDAEFDAIFGPQPHPVEDPTVYVCAPDDPAMRPDAGHESWFVLVNAPRHDPRHGVDWDAPGLAERYADRVLAILAARGLEVRDRLLWHEVRTPAELERATRAPGGSIYGTSSNGPRAAFLRPANASPVPGLFLVGGSAHPGGGLPLVGLSAEIVADLIGPA